MTDDACRREANSGNQISQGHSVYDKALSQTTMHTTVNKTTKRAKSTIQNTTKEKNAASISTYTRTQNPPSVLQIESLRRVPAPLKYFAQTARAHHFSRRRNISAINGTLGHARANKKAHRPDVANRLRQYVLKTKQMPLLHNSSDGFYHDVYGRHRACPCNSAFPTLAIYFATPPHS